MAYSLILTVHIFGALLTGIVASYSGVVLWQRTNERYATCALTLGMLAAFEIFSGSVLSIVSSAVSAASLCANIALYLSLVTSLELLLFIRMKKTSIAFPLAQTLAPVVASLLLFLGAVFYGF